MQFTGFPGMNVGAPAEKQTKQRNVQRAVLVAHAELILRTHDNELDKFSALGVQCARRLGGHFLFFVLCHAAFVAHHHRRRRRVFLLWTLKWFP